MSSDLKNRLLGILYLIPLIVAVLSGAPFTNIAIGIVQALLCYELARLLTDKQYQVVLLSIYFLMSALIFNWDAPDIIIASLAFGSFGFAYFLKGLYAAIFSSILMISLVSLSILLQLEQAPVILAALALIIAAGDSGAYIVGRMIGGRKLAPSISPGKTLSGAFGGLFCSIILAMLVAPHITPIHGNPIIAGLIIGVLAQAGDLYESYFKRKLSVKDSSNLIPGHGGFLDRFDGYLFVLPVYLFALV